METAMLAGEWRHSYARQGISLSTADVLIAATALHYRLTLCTTNRRHFERFEGLSLHPPLSEKEQA
jgi:predicted nucleic acid-binding protein